MADQDTDHRHTEAPTQPPTSAEESPPGAVSKHGGLRTNVLAYLHVAQAAAEHPEAGSAIVNTGPRPNRPGGEPVRGRC